MGEKMPMIRKRIVEDFVPESEEQLEEEFMYPEQRKMSENLEKMYDSLEKIGVKGYVEKKSTRLDSSLDKSGLGWKDNSPMSIVRGNIEGYTFEITSLEENKSKGQGSNIFGVVNGYNLTAIEGGDEIAREIVKKYAPIALDKDEEMELIKKIKENREPFIKEKREEFLDNIRKTFLN
jgi:hypothetical protein